MERNPLSLSSALTATAITMVALLFATVAYDALQSDNTAKKAFGLVLVFVSVLLGFGALQTILFEVVQLVRK